MTDAELPAGVAETYRAAGVRLEIADPRGGTMSRPVTLFTGQWADLPLADLAAKCGGWGFDGLELACWGDHFDVAEAVADRGYAGRQRALLERHGLGVLGDRRASRRPGGVRPDRRAASRRRCRRTCGATAIPRACGGAPRST